MTTAFQQPSLSSQCMAEFLGTALLIFFGTGCVAALKVAGASFGLWEISIIWGIGVSMAIYMTAVDACAAVLDDARGAGEG